MSELLNIKQIRLSQGRFAIIDSDMFDFVNQWKWYFNGQYAVRLDKDKKTISLHRVINDTPIGLLTDHINHNKLDNRRNNLRTVISSQNRMNTKLKDNKSGNRGIYWEKRRNKWAAYIWAYNKQLFLGRFNDIKAAKTARIKAEIKLHGEFAWRNNT